MNDGNREQAKLPIGVVTWLALILLLGSASCIAGEASEMERVSNVADDKVLHGFTSESQIIVRDALASSGFVGVLSADVMAKLVELEGQSGGVGVNLGFQYRV